MALSVKDGSFNITTGAAGSTVVVNDVGFQPKAILFWWSGRTGSTDAAGTADHHRGMGMAVSPTKRRAISNTSVDAAGTSDSGRGMREDACISKVEVAGASSFDGLADLQSMDAGGFTLVIDDAFPINFRVHYLAVGGDDLTDVELISFTTPGIVGASTQDITTVGFEPDAILFLTAWAISLASVLNDATLTFGFWASTLAAQSLIQHGVLAGEGRHGLGTTDTLSYCSSARCLAEATSGLVAANLATVSTPLSNGFRLAWTEGLSAVDYVFALCLKGGNYTAERFTTKTDTVDNIVFDRLQFEPKTVLFISHGMPENTGTAAFADDAWSMGVATSNTSRRAQAVIDEDNVGTSDVGTAIEHDEVYINLDTTMAVEGLMDVVSFDSAGFTLIMDDADPGRAHVSFLAMGDRFSAPLLTLRGVDEGV